VGYFIFRLISHEKTSSTFRTKGPLTHGMVFATLCFG
jgi:hypothetical protein